MDEIWERAVEAALDGQTDCLATRTLTLDGAVKYAQGRLPPPSLLERFQNLQHLSIANIGISSLEQFPRLRNLQKLILSDNRITVGLEFLVQAGLDSLRDLDLSNNRIQFVEDLAPLAELKLVSLDLYECPVTRVKDYRARVFALIKTLKYLDKTDAEGNERPESDEEEDEEDEEDEEEDEEEYEEGDEEDPGSGEVDGDERTEAPLMSNGHHERLDGVVDVDEDEESDAEDDESEHVAGENGTSYRSNGFRLQAVNGEELGEDDGDDSESGEEIDEEEAGEDNDVAEVHEIEDSDNEEDGVDDEEDEEEEGDEEEVDNDDRGIGVSGSTCRLMNAGEIDGHEQGDDDEDGDGETGEDDQVVEHDGNFRDADDDGEEEDEESGEGYLVQPVSQVEHHDDAVGSDIEPINEDNDLDEEEEVEDDLPLPIREQSLASSSSSHLKRKRDDEDSDDDDGDDDGDGDDGDDDEDGVDDEED